MSETTSTISSRDAINDIFAHERSMRRLFCDNSVDRLFLKLVQTQTPSLDQ